MMMMIIIILIANLNSLPEDMATAPTLKLFKSQQSECFFLPPFFSPIFLPPLHIAGNPYCVSFQNDEVGCIMEEQRKFQEYKDTTSIFICQ